MGAPVGQSIILARIVPALSTGCAGRSPHTTAGAAPGGEWGRSPESPLISAIFGGAPVGGLLGGVGGAGESRGRVIIPGTDIAASPAKAPLIASRMITAMGTTTAFTGRRIITTAVLILPRDIGLIRRMPRKVRITCISGLARLGLGEVSEMKMLKELTFLTRRTTAYGRQRQMGATHARSAGGKETAKGV